MWTRSWRDTRNVNVEHKQTVKPINGEKKIKIMNRKFQQWWPIIPTISFKRTTQIIEHKNTTTTDNGYPDPSLW